MIFLVASLDEVFEVEAPTAQGAMGRIADRIFVTEYQKKHGNLSSVEKPLTVLQTRELIRKFTVSTGEYLEYYGYPNRLSLNLLDYLKKIPEPAPPPETPQLGLPFTVCVTCRCERNEDGSEILWKCTVCGNNVCHSCTLTIPKSWPRQYYTGTYCSKACHEADGSPPE